MWSASNTFAQKIRLSLVTYLAATLGVVAAIHYASKGSTVLTVAALFLLVLAIASGFMAMTGRAQAVFKCALIAALAGLLLLVIYTHLILLIEPYWALLFLPAVYMLLAGWRAGAAVLMYGAALAPATLIDSLQNYDMSFVGLLGAYVVLAVTILTLEFGRGEEVSVRSTDPHEQMLANETSSRQAAEQKLVQALAEQETANKKLEQLTKIDEATISSIGEAVLILGEDGLIGRANVSAGRILGVNQTDLKGRVITEYLEFWTESGDKKLLEAELVIGKAIEHRSIVEEIYKVVRPDTSYFYAQMTASPLVVGGAVFGVVLVARDVTDEVNLDKAKSDFVSIASHQLRTPLSTINWYLEMVLEGQFGEVGGEMKEFIEEAYGASQRMGSLIDSLLNVSRIDAGVFSITPKLASLRAVIDSVVLDLDHRIKEKSTKVELDLQQEADNVVIDSRLMSIVFLNLISNAVKYSPPNSSVVVKVFKEGEGLKITVKDEGMGIPVEQQGQIFKKLFRAKNAVKSEPDGTGLGLYIVRSIILALGGSIEFESTQGEGTIFSIYIPPQEEKARAGARELSDKAGV